jgi:aspartate/methionine/tyrosine aminotransferase
VDPTPAFIQSALIASSNSPGYPLTIGSPELRDAMRAWATDVVGVTG